MSARKKPVPCPDCGSKKLRLPICMGGVWVECLDCHKSGPMHSSPERAVAAWNREAIHPKGKAE